MQAPDNEFTSFIREHGFVAYPEGSLAEQGMGNKIDAYVSGDLALRVVYDRGQRFIDLSIFNSNNWRDVFSLSAEIDSEFNAKTGSFSESLKALNKYWPQISAALRTNHSSQHNGGSSI